jgi:general secretion pathway protein D
LLNVSNGDFLSRDGQAVALVHRPDEERGLVQLAGNRPPGAGGVSGEGTVFTLTFQARRAGEGRISIVRVGARGPNMEPIPAIGAEAMILVK